MRPSVEQAPVVSREDDTQQTPASPASSSNHDHVLGLRQGELVRVRSAAEIFRTLDQDGALDGLPFMPEMLQYCGRTWRVSKRADKTCGDRGWGPRRMYNTVHLGDLRCDGAAHGGCQAACLMFWKEAWLERCERGRSPRLRILDRDEQAFVTNTLLRATTNGGTSAEADTTFRCQATEIPRASTRLRFRQVGQYVRDVRAWGLIKVVRGLAIHFFNQLQSLGRRFVPNRVLIAGGRDYPFIAGKLDKSNTPTAKLNLVAGDLVRIKTKQEIVSTLDYRNKNQGLSFDKEMLKYCGRVARVRGRVEQLIDESTGKMIHIDSDCIILDGVVCKADYHLFCTRAVYPYWREIWLERIAA
jgi:hypothetical protein